MSAIQLSVDTNWQKQRVEKKTARQYNTKDITIPKIGAEYLFINIYRITYFMTGKI